MKKEDVKKDITKAVPGGTMPHLGPKQHMKAAPEILPAQKTLKTSPAKTAPKASPEKTAPNISPVNIVPGNAPTLAAPDMSPMQAMPNALPVQATPDKMMTQAAANAAPVSKMPDDMPVQPGPAGVMPSMMNQVPIICCPYLMNMQCPMIHGANLMGMNMMNGAMPFGTGAFPDNMMPYTAGGPVMGLPGNNMYPPYGMGAAPYMNDKSLPMGGMDY